MWQGDLAEPLAAFLQLNSYWCGRHALAAVPRPAATVLINLARKHGALRASMTGFVKAIQDTGRDDWCSLGEAWRLVEEAGTE